MKKKAKPRRNQEILRLLEKAMENMQMGVTITAPNGEILYANSAEARMHGYRVQDLVGSDARIFVPRELWKTMTWERMKELKTWRSESTNIREDGSIFPVQILSDLITGEDGEPIGILTLCEDITERKPPQHAFYDTLTSLPNRALFMDRVNRALKRVKRRQDYKFGVVLLNLDRFKLINDYFGHVLGDELLIACARRLEKCLRFGDTIASFGGDEFAILLEDIKDIGDATFVAERIQNQLAMPFPLLDQQVLTTVSAGIVEATSSYDRPEDVLQDADIAMFRAKAFGRHRYEIFDESMTSRGAAISSLEGSMRHALENEEFVLHYQPVVSLETGSISGVEALARWCHPQHGILYPEDFLAAAEETGLIEPIGEWVLRTACTQMKAWHDAGFSSLYVSVNLSLRQLQQQGLIATIRETLHQTGLDPRFLQLELKETVLMDKAEASARSLAELKEMGVRLSMDDFGTGYSSFGYLKRFSIDSLKMDPSFVRDLTVDPMNEASATAVITLAHNQKIKVSAEGVETEEVLSFLRWHHCDEIQGNLFSEPLPAEKLAGLLKENRSLPLV